MNQDDKNSDKGKKKILVTNRVFGAIDKMVELGIDKNPTRIAKRIGLDYRNTSKYKNGERFVNSEIIYDLVNEVGLNPCYIFLEDGPQTEKLLLENSIHIGGNVGDNSPITNDVKANKPNINIGTMSGGNFTVVHSLDKLINEVPPDLRDKIQEHITQMAGEIDGLKKMVDEHKKELVEKKDELIDTKRELVETRHDLRKKDEKLLATMDELSQVQKKINEVQSNYVDLLKRSEGKL